MVDSTESYDRTIEAAGQALAGGDGAGMDTAESLYKKALAAGERAFGENDISLVPALSGLGATYILRGSLDASKPVLDRAIAISEANLGADHPDFVILLNDLTRLYLKHSAHVYAEPLLQRLLDIKRSKGEEHPEVATVLASLASVRQTLGRYAEAEQLWRRVLDIRERTLAPNHFAIATALEHLGHTCAARGKVREALQLFERAHAMRELTLGAEHASLRASRERIADLQLQASEDSFEESDAPVPAAPSRPRLAVASALSALTPSPHRELPPPPTREATLFPEREPASAKVVVPMRSALAINEPAQSPATVPYLNVLMDIKGEMDADDMDDEAPAAKRNSVEALMTSIGLAFRQRRAAAMIGVAVIALPLVGWGVAGAMRSGRVAGWVQQPIFAQALPRADTTATAAAPLSDPLRASLAGETTQDSASGPTTPPPAAAKPTRAADERAVKQAAADRAAAEEESLLMPPIPGAPITRLDSVVRAISVPSLGVRESFQEQLQAGLTNAPRAAVAELEPVTPARRVRLIGAPPVPRYPIQLAKSGVGGEVRVRFDVDTLGRPLLSTFAVVNSPHASLTASVKRVIPSMRFEPARGPGPQSRTVVESVEMDFTFTPNARNDNDAGGRDGSERSF